MKEGRFGDIFVPSMHRTISRAVGGSAGPSLSAVVNQTGAGQERQSDPSAAHDVW